MATTPVRKLTEKRLMAVRPWLDYPGSVVYFIGAHRGELVKIGFAINLRNRLRALQTGSPVQLLVLAATAGGAEIEGSYHRQFAAEREHGEWFRRSPELRAEMSRLQEIGPPPPSEAELAQRAANIRAYWRAEMKARQAAAPFRPLVGEQ